MLDKSEVNLILETFTPKLRQLVVEQLEKLFQDKLESMVIGEVRKQVRNMLLNMKDIV